MLGGIALAVVTTLSTGLADKAVDNLPVPATRGWVMELIDARARLRDIRMIEAARLAEQQVAAAAQQAASELQRAKTEVLLSQSKIDATLNLVRQEQYLTQGLIYDQAERGLRAELIDMELRLKEDPNDRLVLARRGEIIAALADLARDKAEAECRLQRLRGFSPAGC